MPLGEVSQDFVFAVGQMRFVPVLSCLVCLQINRDISKPDSSDRPRCAYARRR